jgi:hypothetical protein
MVMTEIEAATALLRAGGFHVSAFNETDSRGAAYLLGWTPATLSNKRTAGAPLPPGHRFGRTWLYAIDAVLAFRDSRKSVVDEVSRFTT